jgi:membrane associated rhomboid family serine protease
MAMSEPHDPVLHPEVVARDRAAFQRGLTISALFVAVLWWLKSWEIWRGEPLAGLTIHPREPFGLIGVLTAPFVHGSVAHLVANSLPLLILGTISFWAYPRAAPRAIPLIWLASGLGTWLFGRAAPHLGASGLAHGLMFFVLLLGVLRRDRPAIAAAMASFLLYGGMLLTTLPREPEISWEAHLFGALGGVLAALLWRRLDPPPPRKKYSWELEEELERLQAERDELELPSPADVPVLWHRPEDGDERGQVIPFRGPARADQSNDDAPATAESEPPRRPTLH